MDMHEPAADQAVSDFVARLQSMGLNAAGAGSVLRSIRAKSPDQLLSQPPMTEKE